MQEKQQPTSRKKFLLWSTLLLGSATVFKFFSNNKKKEPDTITMLTQDGKLVSIDMKMVNSSKRSMVTDPELKEWVKK